ncbi:unnamed protein product [Rhizoctonia solani]|uniref:F-box domain-containing protein n=1 Tax=Rhizoctonia solani TaxID=456999 RepID=A0A8H2XKM6_9AGAM|nr:unnamed protein product [Rhizoctonia solani]
MTETQDPEIIHEHTENSMRNTSGVSLLLYYLVVSMESKYYEPDAEQPLFRSKRQRTQAPSTEERVCNPEILGWHMFMRLPVEVFTEITSYLSPVDIISLSRSNKYLRNLLMDRSSRRVWTGAMKNVKGLPPCPPDMSEPYYLALLFSSFCTVCGQAGGCEFYPALRVRLCCGCRLKL